MPQPQPATTTSTLPDMCWFRSSPYPTPAAVTAALSGAGFRTVATIGVGASVIAITITPPGGTAVQVAPEPSNGYGPSSKFDLTSSLQLTLGRAAM